MSIVDTKTNLYAVIGDPIFHSLSPVMHNRAFNHIGYNGVYVAFHVKDVAAAITGMRALDIKGFSVTIPHKRAIMEFVDELDEMAEKIGAVNTVVNEAGKLIGYNSDCLGAVKALKEITEIESKKIVILGAGGAARAIGFGMAGEGGLVTIVNRTVQKGERLARDIGAGFCPMDQVEQLDCHILINTTSVGMTPNIDQMPVPENMFKQAMTVMDIVYNPLKTLFLKTAHENGCTAIDGVAMFVYQGAFQFEQWTGRKAPVDVMREVVINALSGR
ncbi:MAG: shikimate dehydrogenase [Desulfobacterales bacterium]|nr:shikimate dehydrogenase [Desulfobacterales bacterium]